MASEYSITCNLCGATSTGKIKIATLGLRQYKCPHCNHKHSLPLSRTRRYVYWSLTAVLVLAALLFRGPISSFLLILLLVALAMDYRARKNEEHLTLGDGMPAGKQAPKPVGEPKPEQKPSWLAYLGYGVGIVLFLAGDLLLNSLHQGNDNLDAFNSGLMLGNLLGKALVGMAVLALILRALRVKHYGSITVALGGVGFLLFAMSVSRAVENQVQKNNAAIAVMKDLVLHYQQGQPISLAHYPIGQYGELGYALDVFNRDVMDNQKREADIKAEETAVGQVEPFDAALLTDRVRREHSHDQLARLKDIAARENQLAGDLQNRLKTDIGSTPISAANKTGFLSAFNPGSDAVMKSRNAVYKSLDDVLTMKIQMLEIAEADEPKLVKGQCVFNSPAALQKFQDDAKSLDDLVVQYKAAKAQWDQVRAGSNSSMSKALGPPGSG